MAPIRNKRVFGFRYHGNYCGPGWSDARMEGSVAYGKSSPVDRFDRTCRNHDTRYKLGADLNRADEIFYYANVGRGRKADLAAKAVMFQRKLRGNLQTGTEVGFPLKKIVSSKKMLPSPPSSGRKRRSRASGSRRVVRRRVSPSVTPTPILDMKPRRSYRLRQLKKKRTQGRGKRKVMKKYKKAMKKINKYMYLRNGTLQEREDGSVVSDQESMFLGHSSLPMNATIDALCRTMIISLLKEVGINISDMNQVVLTIPAPGGWWRFRINLQADIQNQTTVTADCLMDGSVDTVNIAAANWAGSIRAIVAAKPVTVISIQLYFQPNGTSAPGELRAEFRAADYKLDFYGRSVLRFQNRTGGSTVDGNIGQSTIDNAANPLKIREFQFNGNFIKERSRGTSDTANNPYFIGNNVNGLIYQGTTGVASLAYKKLVPKTFWVGCKSISDMKQRPAEIITSVVESQKKCTLATFFKKFYYEIKNSDSSIITLYGHKLGESKMYQFEKLLDCRINIVEPDITVAFQLDSVVGCKYSYKPKLITNPVFVLGSRT